MTDAEATKWDQVYSREACAWGETPNTDIVNFLDAYVRERKKAGLWVDAAEPGVGVRLLDIGCGWGRNALYAASLGFNVLGVDVSGIAISQGIQRAKTGLRNIAFLTGDIATLKFSRGIFDVVISFGVLNFVDKPKMPAVAGNIYDSLKPGGVAYLVLFNDEFFNTATGIRSYASTEDELRSWFKAFVIETVMAGKFLDEAHSQPHYHNTWTLRLRKQNTECSVDGPGNVVDTHMRERHRELGVLSEDQARRRDKMKKAIGDRFQTMANSPDLLFFRKVTEKLRPGMRVLDIGVGTGSFEQLLFRHLEEQSKADGVSVIGVDISPGMLRVASENTRGIPGMQVCFGSAWDLPFPDESFDIVFGNYTPFSLEEPLRVLKPGGWYIRCHSGIDDHKEIHSAFHVFPRYLMTKEELMTYLLKANLQNITIREYIDIGYMPWPIMEDYLDTAEVIPHYDPVRDKHLVDAFLANYGSPEGVRTTRDTFVIWGKKPSCK